MIEVDFAAHQAMQPVWTHGETLPKQIDVAGLIAAANEDDMAMQRRMRVKLEVLGHRLASRSRFGKRSRSRAMRRDVSIGACLQLRDTGHAVPLPNLGLPQRVEAFDGVLHPVLELSLIHI